MEKKIQKKTEYKHINKLSLFKELDGDNYATLKWSVRNGYPRVTVFTENNVMLPAGKMDYSKVITAPFDAITLNGILILFEGIINSKEKKHITVNCYNAKYENNVKTNDVALQGKFVIGKDENGINYMAVTEEGKPKIKFELAPSKKWFKFLGDNGDEMANLSNAYATGYIKLLTSALEHVIKTDITVSTIEDNRKKTETINDINVTDELEF